MESGDVLRLRSYTSYTPDGKTHKTIRAPQNEVFVCIVLGTEIFKDAQKTSMLDPEKALEKLGWVNINRIRVVGEE